MALKSVCSFCSFLILLLTCLQLWFMDIENAYNSDPQCLQMTKTSTEVSRCFQISKTRTRPARAMFWVFESSLLFKVYSTHTEGSQYSKIRKTLTEISLCVLISRTHTEGSRCSDLEIPFRGLTAFSEAKTHVCSYCSCGSYKPTQFNGKRFFVVSPPSAFCI